MTRAPLLADSVVATAHPERKWVFFFGVLWLWTLLVAPLGVSLAVALPWVGWLLAARRLTVTHEQLRIDRPLLSALNLLHPRCIDLAKVNVVSVDRESLLLTFGGPAGGSLRLRVGAHAATLGAAVRRGRRWRQRDRIAEVSSSLTPRAGSGRRCPYCHDQLEPSLAASCDACSTLYHADCLAEYGRCATLGCAGSQRARAAARH